MLKDEKNMQEKDIVDEKKSFFKWIKEHKKQIIVAGIGVTTIIAIVMGITNKEALLSFWRDLELKIGDKKCNIVNTTEVIPTKLEIVSKTPRSYSLSNKEFDVASNVRTMREGFHHSAEKAAEAEILGIELLPNQTIVSSYVKGGSAA